MNGTDTGFSATVISSVQFGSDQYTIIPASAEWIPVCGFMVTFVTAMYPIAPDLTGSIYGIPVYT